MNDDLLETGVVKSTTKADNKMMASFRIDRDDWKRFGELGKRERLTVTELITDYVEKCLAADRSWYGVEISTGNDDVSIDRPHLISTGSDDVLKLVEEKIREVIEPLQAEVKKLKQQIDDVSPRGQSGDVSRGYETAIVETAQIEMKFPAAKSTTESPKSQNDNIPWNAFFKMVGIDDALPSSKAQKAENKEERNRQIEKALQAARDMGLGEWTPKRGGREFARVSPPQTSP